MEYAIPYEHLEDDLVKSEDTRWCFKKVRKAANKYKLELSDDDFKRFFKLEMGEADIEWIMHRMTTYKARLVDVLISYVVR